MEYNFDKEIDAILRRAAKGETLSDGINPGANHLDADALSAFAENALPEKARQRYTIHLADCDNCRRQLSHLIAFNPPVEPEISSTENVEIVSPMPWYKSLFALPNLAYAMGALVLVFSGIIGLVVLRNINGPNNSEVSQIADKQPNADEASADKALIPQEENMAAPPMVNANAAVLSSNNMMAAANVSAKPVAENTNVSRAAEPNATTAPPPSAASRTESEPTPVAVENKFQSNEMTLDGVAVQKNEREEIVVKDEKAKEDKVAKASRSKTSERQISELPVNGRNADSSLSAAKKSAAPKNNTTNSGGKTFRRADDVWYDTAYTNQPTVNIKRGSDEYKKLDRNIRDIAESLKGTIILVWKEKAYRIQ